MLWARTALDHGEGEEGAQCGLRFPGRSGRQRPQDRGDVERSDLFDRAGMEGLANFAEPTLARMVVLERLGHPGEVAVDREAKGQHASLVSGPLTGLAGAAGTGPRR
ncbi:MAG TPA: hypothetical protein VKG91_13115 [Roseiarcus sp.]|nr:hypothetical protein [Roseiarcus sp.]